MKLLKEIFHKENLNLCGRTVTREAVRAIIFDQGKLFMVFSKKNGDFKFPGGGVKIGEDYQKALIREIREESGVENVCIGNAFGMLIEYDLPKEKEYDLFKMTSSYFHCSVGARIREQRLDHYEQDLGFTPCWVPIQVALRTNRKLLHDKSAEIPRWVRRETFILEQLLQYGS